MLLCVCCVVSRHYSRYIFGLGCLAGLAAIVVHEVRTKTPQRTAQVKNNTSQKQHKSKTTQVKNNTITTQTANHNQPTCIIRTHTIICTHMHAHTCILIHTLLILMIRSDVNTTSRVYLSSLLSYFYAACDPLSHSLISLLCRL